MLTFWPGDIRCLATVAFSFSLMRSMSTEEVRECATGRKLTHVGFIRCISSSTDQPTLAPKDLEKLKDCASKNSGVGIAIIVTYSSKVGCVKAWEWKGGIAASSSSAVEVGLQEVSVATIVRRVEGEKITIEPLAPAPPVKTRFYEDNQSTFDKHVAETSSVPTEDKCSFKGFQFWEMGTAFGMHIYDAPWWMTTMCTETKPLVGPTLGNDWWLRFPMPRVFSKSL